MRGNSQIQEVFVGKSFDSGFTGAVDCRLPIGRGWRFMILNVHYALVRDAGTLVAADADLKALRNLSLKDDRGNEYIKSVPGVMLYRRAQRIYGTAPQRTAVAAATGTYSTQFLIPFSDPRMKRADDTIIDTGDVKEMTLSLQFGSLADFLATSGTESLTITSDCYIGQTADVLPRTGAGSVGYIQRLEMLPMADPDARASLDIRGEDGDFLKRLHVLACNSGNVYPCGGTPAANILSRLGINSNTDKDFRNLTVFTMAALNKAKYQEETGLTGFYSFDFAEGRSIMEALKLWLNNVNLEWTVGVTSTSRLNCLAEVVGLRK